jgi:type II secretory ATPase GspE/PulE/Tfp pilus assembly ATPase PilB-like protein
MGVQPFLLAPALLCVIGQRLVRKLCPKCKKPAQLSPEEMDRVAKVIVAMPEKARAEAEALPKDFFTGVGCSECSGIGYKGRIGIYEIFVMNKEIEQNVLSGKVSEYDIERIAVGNGMVTMVQDGMLKALQGLTSIDEVFRVIE